MKGNDYVFLSYFCSGTDATAKGYCSIDQLTKTGINWLLIGFCKCDWSTGNIDANCLAQGSCCKGGAIDICISSDMLSVLQQFHSKGNVISLSMGDQVL